MAVTIDIEVRTPRPIVEASRWEDFLSWANDCGYDESYFNRFDSKSLEIQLTFLEECPVAQQI